MKKILFIILVNLVTVAGFAQIETTKEPMKSEIAIAANGYDVVSYFTESKAVKGNKMISASYNGKLYLFSQESNKDLFLKNASKYAPQYDGFCAYGMSQDHEAPTSPDAFTIVNEKLYLNYNAKVKDMWLKDQTNLIEKADSNWNKNKK